MSAQEQHACGACGAHNDPGASFCWQCYAPFGPGAAPPPPGGPVPGAPSGAQPVPAGTRPGMPGGYAVGPAAGAAGLPLPQPQPVGLPTSTTASRGGVLGKIVGAVLALAVGAAAYLFLFRGEVTMPGSIDGVPRMTGQTAEQFEEGVAQIAEDEFGGRGAGAMYGSGPLPQFMVIASDVTSVETTDQLFDALISGAVGAGATIDESQAWSGEREGAEYRCVAVGQPLTGACLWREEGSFGVVMTLDRDVEATRELTFAAHDTIFP